MKLKSAVLLNSLKAAYSSLGTKATFTKTGIRFFSALQGYFIYVLERADSAVPLDTHVLNFFKTLTDDAGAAELAVVTFYKSLADSGYASDENLIFHLSKSFSDNANVPENISKAPEKNINDTTLFTDQTFTAYLKAINDNLYVTDDLDGESSIEDDQEIQFFKVRTDVARATETFALSMSFNRAFSNTASSTDAGSLRNQGYADFTFFAEDYVGASRTFT